MDKINVAVYGDYGHQITYELLHKNRNAQLIATCQCPIADMDDSIRVYETLDEMLQDDRIDLISLCSRNRRQQAGEAIRCMKAGKNVYAEKPCAMTEEELDEIIRVSRETGMQFHEMAGTAFEQPFFALQQLVKSGKLGEVVQVYTQKSYPLRLSTRPQDEDIDGGLLEQVGVHNLRFIEHITGLKIQKITASETKIGNTEPDGGLHTAASYLMILENGAVASAVANYLNHPKGFGQYGNECVRVFGTKGYAELMDGARKSRVIIEDEYVGTLDTSFVPKTYFERYIDSLCGTDRMPLEMEDELHPTRMVIRAKANIFQ